MVATQTCRHGFNRPQVGAGSVCHCRKPTLLLQPTRQLFLQNSCSSHHRCRGYKGPRFARLARVQALSPKDDAASGSCPDHRQIFPDQCSRYLTLHRSLRECDSVGLIQLSPGFDLWQKDSFWREIPRGGLPDATQANFAFSTNPPCFLSKAIPVPVGLRRNWLFPARRCQKLQSHGKVYYQLERVSKGVKIRKACKVCRQIGSM
jgi:hypothetical protein